MEKPKRVCMRPGCRGLVAGGVCSQCGPRAKPRDRRPSAASRGYGRPWQRRQTQFLADHPLCEVCKLRGIIRASRIVHHVRRVSEGNEVLAEDRDLVAVCSQACHDRIEPLGRGWRRALQPRRP
jgi:5-methylcytosine-specific restriction protein A